MNRHHAGDGCRGEQRPLSEAELEDVGERMGEMMLALTAGRTLEAMRAGAWIGMHLGPEGEWTLALRLATQVIGLAPLAHCDQDGNPLLAPAFPLDDERVQSMAHHCMAMFPEMRAHTRADIDTALEAAVPLVERFVREYRLDRKHDSRATWEEIYALGDTETEATPELVSRAGACSALLTTWAARYSVTRITA
jgi:hypothetical protein